MRNLIYCLSLSFLVGCGTAEDFQQHTHSEPMTSPNLSGSWSTSVGGSLSEISAATLRTIEEARFYTVNYPVSPLIEHVFVGIELRSNTRRALYTSGLVGEQDEEYWQKIYLDESEKYQLIRHFKGLEAKHAVQTVNALMAQCPYHNRILYTLAMAGAPLSGRPCANVAKNLTNKLSQL